MRRVLWLATCLMILGITAIWLARRPGVRTAAGVPYGVVTRLGTDTGLIARPSQEVKRIKLGTSTRAAVRAISGAGFDVSIDRAGGLLLFSIGGNLPAGMAGVQYVISTQREGHWQPLFEKRLDANSVGWQDYALDVGKLAPGGSTLRFESNVAAPSNNAGDFYWGSIRVLQQRAARQQPNVIVISLDTLRADYLGAFGGPNGVSPNIDSFLSRGVSFRRAYAQYPNTLVSHASMLTGLYPHHHGVYGDEPVLRATSLASIFAEQGYQTAAFTEDAYIGSDFGFDQGFDSFDNGAAKFKEQFSGDCKETFGQAKGWLDQYGGQGRFFLFVHTYEVHTPYTPRDASARAIVRAVDPGYQGPFADGYYGGVAELANNSGKLPLPPEVHKHLAALYAGEINYLDRVVGEFLAHLDELGIAENTLVVLTSDHGEEFGEHGKLGHGETLHNQGLHVPLAFYWPGHVQRGVSDMVVQLIDIVPTVLDLLQLPQPPTVDGASLAPVFTGARPPEPPRPAFAELKTAWGECRKRHLPDNCSLDRLAVQTLDFKLISSKLPESETLYDLRSDPQEAQDVSAQFPGQLEALRALLERYRTDTLPSQPTPAATPAIDSATRERLRALGYIK